MRKFAAMLNGLYICVTIPTKTNNILIILYKTLEIFMQHHNERVLRDHCNNEAIYIYLALSMAVSLVMTATASPVDNIIYQRAFQNSEIGKQQYLYNAYEEFVPQNDEIPNDIYLNE